MRTADGRVELTRVAGPARSCSAASDGARSVDSQTAAEEPEVVRVTGILDPLICHDWAPTS